jgi:hypothetical protein
MLKEKSAVVLEIWREPDEGLNGVPAKKPSLLVRAVKLRESGMGPLSTGNFARNEEILATVLQLSVGGKSLGGDVPSKGQQVHCCCSRRMQ